LLAELFLGQHSRHERQPLRPFLHGGALSAGSGPLLGGPSQRRICLISSVWETSIRRASR
jgi:hypothetical protein